VSRRGGGTDRLPPCAYEFFVLLSKTCQVQKCKNHTPFAGRAPARIRRQGAKGMEHRAKHLRCVGGSALRALRLEATAARPLTVVRRR
jgi:hypothetical protein